MRAVVDTNVIMNVALGKEDTAPADYLPRSKDLLDRAAAQDVELLLPSIVIFELSCDVILRGGKPNMDPTVFRRQKQALLAWCADSKLTTIDVTGDAANWYVRHEGLQGLRLGDAAILASAWYAQADHLYTWDKGLIKIANQNSDILGFTVEEPPQLPSVPLF